MPATCPPVERVKSAKFSSVLNASASNGSDHHTRPRYWLLLPRNRRFLWTRMNWHRVGGVLVAMLSSTGGNGKATVSSVMVVGKVPAAPLGVVEMRKYGKEPLADAGTLVRSVER